MRRFASAVTAPGGQGPRMRRFASAVTAPGGQGPRIEPFPSAVTVPGGQEEVGSARRFDHQKRATSSRTSPMTIA